MRYRVDMNSPLIRSEDEGFQQALAGILKRGDGTVAMLHHNTFIGVCLIAANESDPLEDQGYISIKALIPA